MELYKGYSRYKIINCLSRETMTDSNGFELSGMSLTETNVAMHDPRFGSSDYKEHGNDVHAKRYAIIVDS